jgi:hypothetical protein
MFISWTKGRRADSFLATSLRTGTEFFIKLEKTTLAPFTFTVTDSNLSVFQRYFFSNSPNKRIIQQKVQSSIGIEETNVGIGISTSIIFSLVSDQKNA